MAASKETLETLHDTLATALAEAIQPNADGVRSASALNVARQFLKDNGIEAKPAQGKPLAALADAFPFADNVTPIQKVAK